jgi:hypothetical protein
MLLFQLLITTCVCLPINTGIERISKNIVTEAAKNAIQESKQLSSLSEVKNKPYSHLDLLAQVALDIHGTKPNELVKAADTENIPKNSIKRSFGELMGLPVSNDPRKKFFLKPRVQSREVGAGYIPASSPWEMYQNPHLYHQDLVLNARYFLAAKQAQDQVLSQESMINPDLKKLKPKLASSLDDLKSPRKFDNHFDNR